MGPGDQADVTRSEDIHRARRYSRRRVLAAGVAGGVAIAGGAAGLGYWATRSGPNSPAAAPSPTPTHTATAAALSATPIGLELIKPASADMWESHTFAPGEVVDWTAGIFFLDVGSGAVEAWRFKQASDSAGYPVLTSFFGGDLVATNSGYAINRTTRSAWQWPSDRIYLTGRIGDYYAFRDSQRGNGMSADTPIYLTDDQLRVKSAFTIDSRGPVSQFVVSPDGERMAFVDGGVDGAAVQLHLVELAPGKFIASRELQPPADSLNMTVIASSPVTKSLVVSMSEPSINSTGTPVPNPRSVRLTAPWSGDWKNVTQAEGPALGGFSPDGTSGATMTAMLSQMGVGGFYWPATTVSDPNGTERFTWLSVCPALGTSSNSAWLANSSAMVVTNFAGKENAPFWENYAYSLMDAESGALKPIAIPAEVAPESSQGAAYEFVPAPSPADSDVLALGPTAALHLSSGKLVRANLGADVKPPLLQYPWIGRPNEVAWSLPVLGKDGPQVPFLIPPKLIHGEPPAQPFPFVVAGTGDCLNLRDAPSLTGDVIACVPDGTPLILAEWLAPQTAPYGSYSGGPDGMWVYVSTSGGLKGWVAAAYLDWAA